MARDGFDAEFARLATEAQNDHKVQKAFLASVRASTEVGKVDVALIAAGEAIAVQIDTAVAIGHPEYTAKALYLVPHLTNILRELLATPASRKAAEVADRKAGPAKVEAEPVGKLASLRLATGPNRAG